MTTQEPVLTKYVYLCCYYTTSTKTGFLAKPIKIDCITRSFPSCNDFILTAKAELTKLGVQNVNEVIPISFEEISEEKAQCLFPYLDLATITTLTI